MATNLEIFTPIWETASPTFKERIPQPTQDNLANIGVLIGGDNYTAERNEIFDALVNLIGMQKVWQKSITNPLAFLKSGSMSYGDTYQEIMSDLIEGQTFAIAEDDQFKKWENKVYSAYHRINREQFYPVTIEETKIVRAFRTEGGLQSLVNSLVNQMYSSNNLDEFLLTKKAMQMYYTNTETPLLPAQILTVKDPRTNLLDSNTMKAFVMAVKGTLKQMTFPKKVYNPLGITMMTPASDYVLYLDSSITIAQEVQTLSQAFHPQYMNVNVPIIDIDNFGEGMEDVIGIIADRQWIKIFDTLRRLKMNENARNLYRNYYYHVHQLYAASPFCQVVFIKADGTATTAMLSDC